MRFPGFEGDWETVRLSQIGDFYSGIGFPEKYQGQKELPIHVYKVSDMNTLENEKFMERANNTVDVTILKSMGSSKFVSKPSIIFAKVGAAIFGEKKRITKYPFVTDNNMMSYSPTNRYDIEFVWNWFLRTSLSKSVQTSALPSLNITTLGALEMASPSSEEQGRIAKFLSLIDSRIATQRHLVELLKKHKRGLSNALFSGKVRLAKKGKWKSYRLGEIVRRVTRKNGKSSDVPLTISAQYGLVDQREFFSKSVASADMSGYFLLKKNEFAYNRSSSGDYPFGSIKRLERYEQGAVSTLYICFEALGDEDDAEFLKWYFDSFAWHREVGMICAEGARNHGLLNVPTDGFFNTQHLIPTDKTERMKISSMLALAETRRQNAESELARLTQLKIGLLQQLFV